MSEKGKVGIIGSGFIGQGWAMLFASVGYRVRIYDIEPNKAYYALRDIQQQLLRLEATGMLRGSLSADDQFKLISKCNSLEECVQDAIHVQECIFERIDLKQEIFKKLDDVVDDKIVMCSSTSCFPASSFSEELEHRSQVIVGHPVNPPYYIPLVEIVPAPWTDPRVVTDTKALMLEIGQKPVVLKKEIPGFALNRIQYALMNECWRIVLDDLMSLEDVETSICEGLGLRYAFTGPLETCHLNAHGILEYCVRYSRGIYNVSNTFGPNVKMMGEAADTINQQISAISPLEKMYERRLWRDARLAALSKMKREADAKDLAMGDVPT